MAHECDNLLQLGPYQEVYSSISAWSHSAFERTIRRNHSKKLFQRALSAPLNSACLRPAQSSNKNGYSQVHISIYCYVNIYIYMHACIYIYIYMHTFQYSCQRLINSVLLIQAAGGQVSPSQHKSRDIIFPKQTNRTNKCSLVAIGLQL